jgi:hypothetical protein
MEPQRLRRRLVAALEHGAHRRVHRLGHVAHLAGHLRERVRFEPAFAQRVVVVGVEAGRDQYELRGELERRGKDHVLEHGDPYLLVGSRRDRSVDRVAEALTGARVANRAGAGDWPS